MEPAENPIEQEPSDKEKVAKVAKSLEEAFGKIRADLEEQGVDLNAPFAKGTIEPDKKG